MGWLKGSGFQLLQVDEVGCFDAGFGSDLYQLGRFKKAPRVSDGCPFGEVYDFVRIVVVAEDLIGALAGCFANAGGAVENAFPCRVVGDFVDDENVLHWGDEYEECTRREALILVEMLLLHQIDVLNA